MIGRMAIALAAAAVFAAPAPAAEVEAPMGPLAESAGWQYITASDEMAVYMKHAQTRPSGPVRQLWTAYDSERARDRMGFSFRSVASLGEYDCAKRVSRVVRESFHASQGLTGEIWIQPNFIPTEWAPAAEGTVGEQRMEFACSSKKA